jgi:isoleucyl-tRNA synthetase
LGLEADVDYRKTLNLGKTSFPMKANLPRLEPEIQRFWGEIDLYRTVQAARQGAPKFILHDGPPFSNGDIHLGTALNKILKDIVVKYKTMRGFDCPFVPGWDNHGLPTEIRAIQEFSLDRHAIDLMELRAKSAETARHFVDVQREQFKRLGCRGDWEHPYLTMDPAYEAAVLETFEHFVERGAVYRGLRPVHWCPECETALADAEIDYKEAQTASIYVRFPVVSPSAFAAAAADKPALTGRLAFAVWTTTPWTLPANVAVAVHPDLDYVLVEVDGEALLLARELLAATLAAIGARKSRPLGHVKGRELAGARLRHPFFEREVPVVLADYVTLEQGTGCVHIAPGHGPEDFATGKQYDLPVIQPLDERGVFGAEGGKFAGLTHTQADPKIVEELKSKGNLLAAASLAHSYPHCWRCESPVIFRATKQWFLAAGQFTEQALAAIEQISWTPAWARQRMRNMIVDRPDWCISRQRVWGIPIPALYCGACGREFLQVEVVRKARALFAEHGSDIWFRLDPSELLPSGARCEGCSGTEFVREKDVFSVWFDSSSSHAAVLETRPELGWPADLCLEAFEQIERWFQLSLWNALGSRGGAPYRAVACTGLVLDDQGRKMSKRLGNAIDPTEMVAEEGADILRLWFSYVDFKEDMPTGAGIFTQVGEGYRRLRNTLRFLLMNLHDFDPRRDALPKDQMSEVDRWALHRLAGVAERVTEAYETFEFHRVYYTLHRFCAVDLSQFYLDLLKDRLYTFPARSKARRSAQTALHLLAVNLAKLLAPILTHTAEEVWRLLPGADRETTIQLAAWPDLKQWEEAALAGRWEQFLRIRDEVLKALEEARQQRRIPQPLESSVTIYCDDSWREQLAFLGEELAPVLIVSQASLRDLAEAPEGCFASQELEGIKVRVETAPGEKCVRCWLRLPTVGGDAAHPGLCHRCRQAISEGT